MNTTRDHYASGVAPDWSHRQHAWQPAVAGPAAEREQWLLMRDSRNGRLRLVAGEAPAWHRSARPMALRRTQLNARQLESLKARWFALGSLATSAVLGAGWLLVQLMAVLP